jgi:hypothetical protein
MTTATETRIRIAADVESLSMSEKLQEAVRLANLLGYDGISARTDLPLSDEDKSLIWAYIDGLMSRHILNHVEGRCSLAEQIGWDMERADYMLACDIMKFRGFMKDLEIVDPERFSRIDMDALFADAVKLATEISTDEWPVTQFTDCLADYYQRREDECLLCEGQRIAPVEGVSLSEWEDNLETALTREDVPPAERHAARKWLVLNTDGHRYPVACRLLINAGLLSRHAVGW